MFLWKCHKVENALFLGISYKNTREKVSSYVIPMNNNGSGNELLFFQKLKLYFSPKVWLMLPN